MHDLFVVIKSNFSINFEKRTIRCEYCRAQHSEKEIISKQKFAHKPTCSYFRELQQQYLQNSAIEIEEVK